MNSFDLLRSTIESLSFLGIDTDGSVISGDGIRQIDADLATLATQLRSPDLRLGRVSQEFEDISAELTNLDLTLASVLEDVDAAGDVLANYEAATAEADRIVYDSLQDIDTRRVLARTFVIVFGGFGVMVATTGLIGGWAILRAADARLARDIAIDDAVVAQTGRGVKEESR